MQSVKCGAGIRDQLSGTRADMQNAKTQMGSGGQLADATWFRSKASSGAGSTSAQRAGQPARRSLGEAGPPGPERNGPGAARPATRAVPTRGAGRGAGKVKPKTGMSPFVPRGP